MHITSVNIAKKPSEIASSKNRKIEKELVDTALQQDVRMKFLNLIKIFYKSTILT